MRERAVQIDKQSNIPALPYDPGNEDGHNKQLLFLVRYPWPLATSPKISVP